MKFKVISHEYRNTGGNTMVSVFQIYLIDQNRTVFVNCGERSAYMTTVDYVNHFDPDDYDEITIEWVDFTQGMSAEICTYYDVFSHCLYEWLKSDCKHYHYRMGIHYCWLPEAVRVQISTQQKDFVEDEMGGDFYTDGYYVYVPTPSDEDDEIPVVTKHKSLHDTLAACLGRLTDKLEIDGVHMAADDLHELRVTIADVHHYLYNNN